MESAKDEQITINKKTFLFLAKRSLRLCCLEIGGVQDWDGYEKAYEEYENLTKIYNL